MLRQQVKRLLLLIEGVLIPLIGLAQHSLSGRVVSEKDGTPIVNAAIYIKNNNIGVFTDQNGLYHIKFPQSGKYTIRVSFMGYNTIIQTVNVKGESTLNFTLKENSHELNEVVVRGSAQKAEINRIRQSPMAVTVVDGAKLRGRSSGIEEILTRTSGIKVRKSGGLGSASRISVHGLEGKRVAVYINGFPLNSPDGSFDINDIPIDVIKYIEVYKGIVPAEYGGDGLGGAINIVTREDECDLVTPIRDKQGLFLS